MTKLMCPVCDGEMQTEHIVGMTFDIDNDPHGFSSTEWFSVMWYCPKMCCYAEDWWFDDEHSDFNQNAVRNNQTYWYDMAGKEIKRDEDHMVSPMEPR